jgi:peptidyl-prolyl cis-trans isomerase SurA
MSAAEFSQAMQQSGIDPATFKDFLRANLAWREIIRARFRATVDVTEQDVTAALSSRQVEGGDRTMSEFMLQQIVFIVPEGAGAGTEAAQRNQANAFRSNFQGCDSSLALARGRPGVVVRPTVRREEGQITGELKDAILALPVGGITGPERIDEGFQLVALCARNAIAGETQATQEVREEITTERGQLLARRYLRDLRSDAIIEYR